MNNMQFIIGILAVLAAIGIIIQGGFTIWYSQQSLYPDQTYMFTGITLILVGLFFNFLSIMWLTTIL